MRTREETLAVELPFEWHTTSKLAKGGIVYRFESEEHYEEWRAQKIETAAIFGKYK